MTLKVSTGTGTVSAVACLPEQGVFIVRNNCKTTSDIFLVLCRLAVYIRGHLAK